MRCDISQLLNDFLELPAFAAEVKRHPRTVRRWLDGPDGLPYTNIGHTIIIHVPTVRRMRNQKKRDAR